MCNLELSTFLPGYPTTVGGGGRVVGKTRHSQGLELCLQELEQSSQDLEDMIHFRAFTFGGMAPYPGNTDPKPGSPPDPALL